MYGIYTHALLVMLVFLIDVNLFMYAQTQLLGLILHEKLWSKGSTFFYDQIMHGYEEKNLRTFCQAFFQQGKFGS